MDFGVGQTPVHINIKMAHVERTMEAEAPAAEKEPVSQQGSL
jgi:hypothetical protein